MKRTIALTSLALAVSLVGCNSTDTRTTDNGNRVDSNGKLVDARGNHVDANGNRVDVSGSGVDAAGNRIDSNGNRLDANGNRYPNGNPDHMDNQARSTVQDGSRDPDQMTGEVTDLKREDQYFVAHAAAGGAYEIRTSKLALDKSSNDNVKKIAQRMIDDHTKANDQLATLAGSKGLHPVYAVTPDQQKMIDKLSGLSGADFDREYLNQQETAHKDTIILFQQEDRQGKDIDVKKWATGMLNALGDHLAMIQEAEKGSRMTMDNP